MKRLLAIILSLAMLIGAVPAVFAEGEATAVNSPTYLFTADAFKNSTTGETLASAIGIDKVFTDNVLDRTKSTGEWSYITKESVYGYNINAGNNANLTLVITNANASVGTNVLGLKLTVDKPGTYIPKLDYFAMTADSARVNMFLVPASTHTEPITAKDLKAFITEATSGEATDIECIFEDVKQTGTGSANWVLSTENGKSVQLESGTYYLVISIGKSDSLTGHAYAYLKSLTFERQPYVTVSVPSATVDKEKTIALGEATVFSGEDVSLGKLTMCEYKSLDTNVATVDENGVVTGVAMGTATITVTGTLDGVEYTGSVDITVNDPDIFEYTPVYKFIKTAVSGKTDSDSVDVTEITTSAINTDVSSGKWGWIEKISTLSLSVGAKNTCISVSNANATLGTNVQGFEIIVDHDGTYIPSLNYDGMSGQFITKIHMFLVPAATHAKPDNYGLQTLVNEALTNTSTDIKYIFNAVDTTSTGNYVDSTKPGNTVELSKGTYYLLISLDKHSSVTGNNLAYIKSLSLERTGPLPEGEEPGDEPEDTVQTAPETVAYATNIDGVISVMGTGITRGTEVTVTAPEVTGKVFRHWVLGTATNGTWVSDKATYTFPLMTNTYLTAVYTDAPAENAKIVEFFNYSGEYLTQKTVDAEGKVALPTDEPSLTGYVFSRWLLAKDTPVTEATVFTNAITRVVAELTATGSYTVNGAPYTYDDKISDSSNEEVEWYRDGILVGYGMTYDYFVWDDVTAITNAPISGAKAPVVVLDDAVKAGKACMIEYDAAGKTIKEVGILFGATDEIDVDSCDSKATSQRKDAHGQFTAKPRTDGNASYARGYIIYEDSGLKVKYTDAISLPNN